MTSTRLAISPIIRKQSLACDLGFHRIWLTITSRSLAISGYVGGLYPGTRMAGMVEGGFLACWKPIINARGSVYCIDYCTRCLLLIFQGWASRRGRRRGDSPLLDEHLWTADLWTISGCIGTWEHAAFSSTVGVYWYCLRDGIVNNSISTRKRLSRVQFFFRSFRIKLDLQDLFCVNKKNLTTVHFVTRNDG